MDLFMCGEIRVLLTRKSTFSPKECFKPEKVCFKLERVLCLSGRSEIKIVFDSMIKIYQLYPVGISPIRCARAVKEYKFF